MPQKDSEEEFCCVKIKDIYNCDASRKQKREGQTNLESSKTDYLCLSGKDSECCRSVSEYLTDTLKCIQ